MIKKITFPEVKAKLSKVGIFIYRNSDVLAYEVYPKGDKRGEDSTYETIGLTQSDLIDALNTGLDMAERLKVRKARQNPKPKCKIIQVRRKIRIAGKLRVVHARKRICNPELDLARMQRLLASELSQYDQRLQARQPNNHRLAHYFNAVDKAFARLDNESTLEDMKESICRSFDPELPPVKKFLKKHT